MFDQRRATYVCNARYLDMYGLRPERGGRGRRCAIYWSYRQAAGTFKWRRAQYVSDRLQRARRNAPETGTTSINGRGRHGGQPSVPNGGGVTRTWT